MLVEHKQGNFCQESGVVFKESYYELSVGVLLHMRMFMTYTDQWGESYFGSPCDGVSSGFAIFSLLLMVTLPTHAIYLRLKAKNIWEREEMMKEHPIYFDNLRINGYSCLHEVYCMYNKSFTAFILIFLSDFTIFQGMCLLQFSLFKICTTIHIRPF